MDTLPPLGEHLPCGIRPLSAGEVGLSSPSLQSQIRVAEYAVALYGPNTDTVRNAVANTISARSLPTEYKREAKTRHYDLRPLILDLRLEQDQVAPRLIMRLRAEPERTARADQVRALLGLPDDAAIERVAMEVEEVSAVLLAYRRFGEGE
jgi:hypothetical protein